MPMVDILGSIDEKIENIELLITKTNANIKNLFLDYSQNCSDFRKLSELCSVITKGTTPTTLKKSFVEIGIPFIKVESLTDSHQIDKSKIAYIDEETHELLNRSKLHHKDLLVSIAGTIGRFALLPQSISKANTNQAVALIRGNLVSQEYLYALFVSGLCEEQIKAKTVQAVQANLSLSVIGSLVVPFITDSTFNLKNQAFTYYIEHLTKEKECLLELKSLYLRKFFG